MGQTQGRSEQIESPGAPGLMMMGAFSSLMAVCVVGAIAGFWMRQPQRVGNANIAAATAPARMRLVAAALPQLSTPRLAHSATPLPVPTATAPLPEPTSTLAPMPTPTAELVPTSVRRVGRRRGAQLVASATPAPVIREARPPVVQPKPPQPTVARPQPPAPQPPAPQPPAPQPTPDDDNSGSGSGSGSGKDGDKGDDNSGSGNDGGGGDDNSGSGKGG